MLKKINKRGLSRRKLMHFSACVCVGAYVCACVCLCVSMHKCSDSVRAGMSGCLCVCVNTEWGLQLSPSSRLHQPILQHHEEPHWPKGTPGQEAEPFPSWQSEPVLPHQSTAAQGGVSGSGLGPETNRMQRSLNKDLSWSVGAQSVRWGQLTATTTSKYSSVPAEHSESEPLLWWLIVSPCVFMFFLSFIFQTRQLLARTVTDWWL